MHVQNVLPRDAIPSIDDPSFDTGYFGDGDDQAVVVDADPPRAYPIRILSRHEIVNDVVDGLGSGGDGTDGGRLPIAVTWCPICASAVVYDRRVDGRTLTFGTSGKLADDALVAYDRETGSEWKQPLGTAIDGPLGGRELRVVPASVLSVAAFRSAHPDGVVLLPVHGGDGDPRGRTPEQIYDTAPYDRYDSGPEFGLRAMRGEGPKRSWDREDIDAKTTVLGVVRGDDAVGYPAPVVAANDGVVADTVGGASVIVVAAGTELHAFEDPGHEFALRDGTLVGDGTAWDLATGRSDDGRQLARVPARRLYAFAWQDDHGPGRFYGLSASGE